MPTVQVFLTCLVQGLYPDVGDATVAVLQRAGCVVTVARNQTCCGQAAFNAGLTDDARRLAVKVLRDLGEGDDPIVVPSGSCADMLIHHVPELLAGDPKMSEEASRLASRVFEFTSFLVDQLGLSNVGARYQGRVAYHPSCHGLRNLGLSSQARTLLAEVDGLTPVEIERAEECCGFGGLFSVELPEVSTAIMASKLEQIERAAPDVLVGGDVSCLLHLGGGLHKRRSGIEVRHIAQILASQSDPGEFAEST
ncbi:MAG: (Fe-S)-binding protein [Actinomycetota bacterium]